MNKILYKGKRDENERTVVTKNNKPLDIKIELKQYTKELDWGGGNKNGALQLAFAILYDFMKSDNLALDLHEDFCKLVVENMNKKEWELNELQVEHAISIINNKVKLHAIYNKMNK